MFILKVAEVYIAVHKGTTISKGQRWPIEGIKAHAQKEGWTLVSGTYMCIFLYIK